MNTVEGFFVESGLFLKCPHCKNRTRQNVQSFFLSIHMNKPVTCTKCEKEFTIHVELRPFVEAVEQSVQRTAEPCCQVCLMPLSQHVHECVIPSTRRR